MRLTSSANKLREAHDVFRVRWNRVQAEWDDAMSKRVERDVVEPAEHKTRDALAAIRQMDEAIAQAAAECR